MKLKTKTKTKLKLKMKLKMKMKSKKEMYNLVSDGYEFLPLDTILNIYPKLFLRGRWQLGDRSIESYIYNPAVGKG